VLTALLENIADVLKDRAELKAAAASKDSAIESDPNGTA